MSEEQTKIKPLVLPYKMRTPLHKTIHEDPHRFRVIVAHRRFGKTTLAINELIIYALTNPGRYWYVAPTYRQAKTVAHHLLLQYLPSTVIKKRNDTELTFTLSNGSEIALKGAENKDSLRGVGLQGLVLDEYGMMERDVWEAVLQPTLQDTGGWAIFLGTPLGRNHFFELYCKQDNLPNTWKSFQISSKDSNLLNPQFVEEAKKELPEDTFRQEYLAEFLDGQGTVFRNLKEIIRPQSECYEEPIMGKRYQIGVDLARLRDYTVFTVVDTNLKVAYWERFTQLDWDFQKIKLLNLIDKYGNARTFIDATGIGDPFVQEMQRQGANVVPYAISSNEKKRVLINNLKLRIEQKQLTIPDEPILIRELEAYNYELLDSGKIKFGAPSGFHDDSVISLALAVSDLEPYDSKEAYDRIPEYSQDF